MSASESINAKVRLYDRLFDHPNPAGEENFIKHINSDSCIVKNKCYLESNLKNARSEDIYQFERLGYFCVDMIDSAENNLVFNRTATLRDTWAKIKKS